MDLLPKSEALARVSRLQTWMRTSGLDAVFILQNADQFYFSGTVQTGLLCIPAAGEPILLVQKSAERARMESPWSRILSLSGFRAVPDLLAVEGIRGLKKIGLEMDVLPASYFFRFQKMFPDVEFVDAAESIRALRMLKSPYEVEQIRQAARQLDAVFRGIPEWVRPGMTELEISARIEGLLRLHGHQGITRMRTFNAEIAFGVVAAGASGAHPTSFPGALGFAGLYPAVPNGSSRRPLDYGVPLVVDMVGGCGGYIADQTRTFVAGELPRDMEEAHRFAIRLLREVESMLLPETSCKQIYRRVLEKVKDSPYASTFMGIGDSQVRFVGHGLGLELDELPVLADGFEVPLKAGMTIAVEPKILFPDRGAVGVENTYVITPTGFEKLTPAPESVVSL